MNANARVSLLRCHICISAVLFNARCISSVCVYIHIDIIHPFDACRRTRENQSREIHSAFSLGRVIKNLSIFIRQIRRCFVFPFDVPWKSRAIICTVRVDKTRRQRKSWLAFSFRAISSKFLRCTFRKKDKFRVFRVYGFKNEFYRKLVIELSNVEKFYFRISPWVHGGYCSIFLNLNLKIGNCIRKWSWSNLATRTNSLWFKLI